MKNLTPVRVVVAINPRDLENRYEILVVKDIEGELSPEDMILKVAGQTPHDAINRLKDEFQIRNVTALDMPTSEWWKEIEEKNSLVC